VEQATLAEEVRGPLEGADNTLCGDSLAMRRLFDSIRVVSQHRHTVLIAGEHGCGKGMVARAIHAQGPLAARPFLTVDCGSLAPELLENELFGNARGAFPGAVANRAGVLEAARGGTVFLNEVAGMPLELQWKLLQALREREFQPVGCHRRVKLNARILSSSSRNLDVAVRSGTFRQDLYGRLSVAMLRVPPLREHKSDIPLLVNHFLEKYQVAGQASVTVSEDALRLLQGRDWPGNVRELENCIQRAAASAGPMLRCADLAADLIARSAAVGSTIDSFVKPPSPEASDILPTSASEFRDPAGVGSTIPLAELEKRAILHAILISQGDKILAARRLGIGKTTVYRKLKEYGVQA
jgi:two-component system response regulator HydG